MSEALHDKVRGSLVNPTNASFLREPWPSITSPSGQPRPLRTKYLNSCIRQAIARDGRPPARRFYKYTKSKYADMMVNDGVIRVGSLVDYQNGEQHAGGILDEAEGTQTVVVQVDDEVWTAETIPAPLKSGMLSIAPGQSVYVNGVTFDAIAVANAYVYCVSLKYDETLLSKDQFDADAIVEIVDAPGFLSAVDEVMARHECTFYAAVDCKYVGRVHRYGDGTTLYSAVEVKEQRYSNQAESRLVWRARDDKVEKPAIMIANPAIAWTCRRIY